MKHNNLEYCIIVASSPPELSNEVRKAMVNYWKPIGGVSAVRIGDATEYYQAMMRKIEAHEF